MDCKIIFWLVSAFSIWIVMLLHILWKPFIDILYIIIPFILLGIYDLYQKKSNILRNYPVWGHWRFLLLSIRPQIQQYFIHTDQSGRPFNSEQRNLVYSRANKTLDKLPFGTQLDVSEVGYEWANHSMQPVVPHEGYAKIMIGNEQCRQPYNCSRLNISAMSFGAISQNAVRALNRGAKIGGFAHNTGEGGLSQYHLMEGGDLIWQIGTAYFGCKNAQGKFDPELFSQKSQLQQVKMIEIKLSQGAKPAHGGILPKAKITAEIARAREIPRDQDCLSPALHSSFDTPLGLIKFVQRLRTLSGGKPIGFKLCLGIYGDFMAICKAMLALDIYPDFITIDGAEGGTGAAPVEFTNSIGTPLEDALIFIHNALVGLAIRDKIRLLVSGKIISGFDLATKIALGADGCYSARGMMFSLGCVQSRRCHNNTCPTGVATQDPKRMYGLSINDKAPRVANFHQATLDSFKEVLGAIGLSYPEQLTPCNIHRRTSDSHNASYDRIYPYIEEGSLLDEENLPERYAYHLQMASPHHFCNIAERVSSPDWQHHKHIYVRKYDEVN